MSDEDSEEKPEWLVLLGDEARKFLPVWMKFEARLAASKIMGFVEFRAWLTDDRRASYYIAGAELHQCFSMGKKTVGEIGEYFDSYFSIREVGEILESPDEEFSVSTIGKVIAEVAAEKLLKMLGPIGLKQAVHA